MNAKHLEAILGPHALIGVDAGSRGGVPGHWRDCLGPLRVHGFEPDEEACAIANKRDAPNVIHHPLAIGATEGLQTLYVTAAPSGSSFFRPNLKFYEQYHGTARMEIAATVDVPTARLEDVLADEPDGPHAMKLDVQGAELDIIAGTGARMDSVLTVETEVEFAPLYEDQPLFCDVMETMDRHGFDLWDLRTHRVYRARDGQTAAYLNELGYAASGRALSARLVAGDALFIRRVPADADEATHRRFIALLCIYGFYDAALGHAREQQLDDAAEAVRKAAPKPRAIERPGPVGRVLRGIQGKMGRDSQRVFWTRRRFPDQ